MMNKLSLALTIGVALTLAAAPILAQGPGGRGPGGFPGRGPGGPMMGGGLRMLAIPEVQKELKLDPAQVDLLRGLQAESDAKMRSLFDRSRGDGGSRESSRAEFEKLRAEQDKQVAEILDAKQRARLKQLEVQQSGVRALGQPAVQKQLALTAEQKQKIGQALENEREAMRAAFTGGGFDPSQRDQIRQKMMTIRTSTETKLNAVLTDGQKKQFTAMQGPKFNFPERRFDRGGPGGRPGVGRPGGGRPGGPRPSAT